MPHYRASIERSLHRELDLRSSVRSTSCRNVILRTADAGAVMRVNEKNPAIAVAGLVRVRVPDGRYAARLMP
jgi:hypothetical protein